MCARYFIDRDFDKMISIRLGRIVDAVLENSDDITDVHPSDEGLIIEKEAFEKDDPHLTLTPMKWGFPCYDKKGLIINARAENIEERKSFVKGINHNRCIVPVSGFYEWDDNRDKVTFRDPGGSVLLLAAIFDSFNGENRFTIITRDANPCVKPFHDRMPLIITGNMLEKWFSPEFREVLTSGMPELSSSRKYEQLSLFDL